MSLGGPSTESPRARIAARWAPRATNVTSLPAFARTAPNDPPTPPAPITAIRIVSVPAVMLGSALDAGVVNLAFAYHRGKRDCKLRFRNGPPMGCRRFREAAPGTSSMSALPPKADIGTQSRHVRFVPKADMAATSILG